MENKKDTFLHLRISTEHKKFLIALACYSNMTISEYIDKLISSTYFRFFNTEGELIEDKETYINN